VSQIVLHVYVKTLVHPSAAAKKHSEQAKYGSINTNLRVIIYMGIICIMSFILLSHSGLESNFGTMGVPVEPLGQISTLEGKQPTQVSNKCSG
jgi:hypothetical protein